MNHCSKWTAKIHWFLFLALLEAVCTRVGISQGYENEAFLQTDGELRYVIEDSSGTLKESLSEDKSKSSSNENNPAITVLGSPIKFEPLELDFQEQPLGIPFLRKVMVRNLNSESSIQMLSISGNTIHFHCSFFADKVIPPSGNTTFDVVYLGREEGSVENTLYIHTSAGSFRFVVRASGSPNPYRLKPLVGLKMPVNSSYSPTIRLHNPHPEPIQVLEMYSSGGDLHLELPSGDHEGPQTLWQIAPYQTKAVMKANFIARLENNHTAYIRIKTNSSGAEFLYLPLEVEVTSQPGLFCPQEIIDFGLLPSRSEPVTIDLLLLNSANKPIPVQNVIATPVTEAVNVVFESIKVPADTLKPTTVAKVSFDPLLATEEGLHTGKIVIKSRNSQFKITLPYKAFVLKGDLSVNETSTHFQLWDESLPDASDERSTKNFFVNHAIQVKRSDTKTWKRNFTVHNEFNVPVAIHRIIVAPGTRKFFNFKTEFRPVILKPGQKLSLMELELKKQVWGKEETMILESRLTLQTNISDMDVPIICFHGRLRGFLPHSPTPDTLNFGTLGMDEKKDIFFTVINPNPVGITLRGWGSNMNGVIVEMMGVAEGAEAEVMQVTNYTSMTKRLYIPAKHFMVFRIGVSTKEMEGNYNGTVFIEADYHAFHIPFKFTVAKGSLQTVPRELAFNPVFPGNRVEMKLKVFSSFAQEMTPDSVVSVPQDPRFTFKVDSKGGKIISGQKNLVGKIEFDPGAACRQDDTCYAGFSVDGKVGSEWFQGLTLAPKVSESDIGILQTLYSRLTDAIHSFSYFNVTLKLETDQVRGFLFKAKAYLTWPRIAGGIYTKQNTTSNASNEENGNDIIHFPLTQVGNASFVDVVLNNPSLYDLYLHLVPFGAYPNAVKMYNALPAITKHPKNTVLEEGDFWDSFKVLSVLDSNTKTPLRSLCDEVEHRFGLSAHADTKAFVLKAGHAAKVRLRFRPEVSGMFRSALYIRNNLTGIEILDLSAQSVYGSLSFGAWKSNLGNTESDPNSLLSFEVKEKHLKDCQPDKVRNRRYSPPVLTVRRGFRLKNTGMTSIYVSGFDIEGAPCEGFGFKVLNCDGFALKPEEQREIDIAFTPDFTLSAVSRILTIHTSMSPNKLLNFTMEATVPSSLMAQCSESLPRPTWEAYLAWGVNGFMLMLVVCVVLAAYFESDRITKTNMIMPIIHRIPAIGDSQVPDGTPFDLRNIPQQVNNELRQRINTSNKTRNVSGTGGRSPKPGAKPSPPVTPPIAQNKPCKQTEISFLERSVSLPGIWVRRLFTYLSHKFRNLWESCEPDSTKVSESVIDSSSHNSSQTGKPSNASGPHDSIKQVSSSTLAPNKSSNTPINQSRKNKKAANRKGRNSGNFVGKGLSSRDHDDMETCSTTTESSNLDDESLTNNKGINHGFPSSIADTNDLNTPPPMLEAFNINSNPTGKKGKGKNKKPAIKEESKNSKSEDETRTNSKDKQPKSNTSKNNNASTSKQLQKQETKKGVIKQTPASQDVAKAKVTNEATKKLSERNPSKVENIQKSSTATPSLSERQIKLLPSSSSNCHAMFSRPPLSSNETFESNKFYSAISCSKQKAKVTPVGKILPEPKKTENLGAQYGPIGPRPYIQPRQSTWANSPAEAKPIFQGNPMFGPISHAEKPKYTNSSPLHRSNSSPFNQSQQELVGLSDMNIPPSTSNSSALMQPLEHRQRATDEYIRQNQDWPGFNEQRKFLENLWDTVPNGNNDRTKGPSAQTWGSSTMEDAWPSSAWNVNPQNIRNPIPSSENQQVAMGYNATHRGFDPMGGLSSIWNNPQLNMDKSDKNEEQNGMQEQNNPWSGSLFNN